MHKQEETGGVFLATVEVVGDFKSAENLTAARSSGLINTEVRDARDGRFGACTSCRWVGVASAYVAAASRKEP